MEGPITHTLNELKNPGIALRSSTPLALQASVALVRRSQFAALKENTSLHQHFLSEKSSLHCWLGAKMSKDVKSMLLQRPILHFEGHGRPCHLGNQHPCSRASAIARHRSASLCLLSSATSDEKDSNLGNRNGANHPRTYRRNSTNTPQSLYPKEKHNLHTHAYVEQCICIDDWNFDEFWNGSN